MTRLAAATIIFLAVFTSTADARHLSKRQGRAEAYAFIAPAIDLIDVHKTIRTVMTPPRDCRRINRATVACRFAFVVHDQTVRARAVAHLQRDGLIGIWMSVDPAAYWDWD